MLFTLRARFTRGTLTCIAVAASLGLALSFALHWIIGVIVFVVVLILGILIRREIEVMAVATDKEQPHPAPRRRAMLLFLHRRPLEVTLLVLLLIVGLSSASRASARGQLTRAQETSAALTEELTRAKQLRDASESRAQSLQAEMDSYKDVITAERERREKVNAEEKAKAAVVEEENRKKAEAEEAERKRKEEEAKAAQRAKGIGITRDQLVRNLASRGFECEFAPGEVNGPENYVGKCLWSIAGIRGPKDAPTEASMSWMVMPDGEGLFDTYIESRYFLRAVNEGKPFEWSNSMLGKHLGTSVTPPDHLPGDFEESTVIDGVRYTIRLSNNDMFSMLQISAALE
jgi:hypothetical protein